MKLVEFRKKKKLSQVECAAALEKHAHENHPEIAAKLPQRTLASWEQGAMPRKNWRIVIESFTKKQVTASDFDKEESQPRGAQ